ncbi:MAG: polysaccharide biosynthesis C-terminal domain-containing protein [Clostridia bacterium]|nr:polysaccharide biosynthesis C-terminal domain-containing protein [Clostridia bacterium]
MDIKLSDHFTYKRLIRFTLPSVIMMIFTSIYGVVDGIFVSNFVGKTPFAAINLIMPVCMIFGSIGFMVGTGGSALVSMTLGQGNSKRANEIFSMLIYVSLISSAVLAALGFIFLEPIAVALGAEGEMLKDCLTYGRILIPASVAFVLQNEFQSFLICAERPKLGLFVTVCAGVTNIVLDALLIAGLGLGLVGAAVATAISQIVGAVIPLLFFAFNKKSILRLTGAPFDGKALLKTCANGSSEMMTNLSLSIVNILYNFQLISLAGEDGVAAYGVIMYINFIFISVFIGFSVGSAPIISYHYGAQNSSELKSLSKKSLALVAVCAVIMTAFAELLSAPLSGIFVGYDKALFEMTRRGFMIYSVSFLIMGFNIFASSFFTALNNGIVSAVLSFARTLLFQVISVLLLPIILGLDGIWLSITAAELFALGLSAFFFVKMRKRYDY